MQEGCGWRLSPERDSAKTAFKEGPDGGDAAEVLLPLHMPRETWEGEH